MLFALGDSNGAPYTYPGNPSTVVVSSYFQAPTIPPDWTSRTFSVKLQGVVDLSADALTAILVSGSPIDASYTLFGWGSVNVYVSRVA